MREKYKRDGVFKQQLLLNLPIIPQTKNHPSGYEPDPSTQKNPPKDGFSL